MADEPSITRWSFQDFKMFYDVKFGRKKETIGQNADTNGQANGKAVTNGSVASNGNGHVKNTSDMAVYVQYRSQDPRSLLNSNGHSSAIIDERPQKPLLPPFESAKMRTLAGSWCRIGNCSCATVVMTQPAGEKSTKSVSKHWTC